MPSRVGAGLQGCRRQNIAGSNCRGGATLQMVFALPQAEKRFRPNLLCLYCPMLA